jgi:pimeloyl-ACP methyl ester carboxylesterase
MQHPTARDRRQAASAGPPPIGGFHEVEGRRLFLHRSGSGDPPVVVVPGASAVGLDYLNLHEATSTVTTSVIYDRGGTGWSDRVKLPRTAAAVAVALRSLLRVAGVPAPYVLVAHSLGGAYVRRYAQMFPEEVAGVLLLDAFSENWDAFMPEHLHLARARHPQPGRLQSWLLRPFVRRLYARMLAEWPRPVRELLIERHLDPVWLQSGARERSNLPALRDELLNGGDLPDVPLVVLTALGVDAGQALVLSRKALRELTEGKCRLGSALADSVTSGEHRTLEDARHSTIHTDCPDAVIQAIRDLLDRVKGQRRAPSGARGGALPSSAGLVGLVTRWRSAPRRPPTRRPGSGRTRVTLTKPSTEPGDTPKEGRDADAHHRTARRSSRCDRARGSPPTTTAACSQSPPAMPPATADTTPGPSST